MLSFDPLWGGQNIIQDTPPGDALGIVFLPSIVGDVLGAIPQLESEESSRSFMQTQFRVAAENMNDAGLIYSAAV